MLYILHENDEWIKALIDEFKKNNIEFTLWFVNNGINGSPVDFGNEPPDGVFYNRTSCSSHTRGHSYSIIYMQQILNWLESYGRRVINGSKAFNIEISKTVQYTNLIKDGFNVPKTNTFTSPDTILKTKLEYPCMVKDNQGGSGSGIFFITSHDNLVAHLQEHSYPISPDKLTLVQEYIESPIKRIYRVECIDGKHLYTLSVDTKKGFNLCPATSCQMEVCPLKAAKGSEQFKIIENPHPELLEKYLEFSKKYKLDIVAFEYIVDKDGICWTYDINCNTNYNHEAEENWGQINYAYRHLIEFFTKLTKNL